LRSVLFGWELGANLGHAKPLASIARRLKEDGVRLIVAARDLMYARLAFGDLTEQIFQAPIWPNHRHSGSETSELNYLDVLANIGFADPVKLGAVVGGWTALIDLVKPNVIVADHSPGLLLAARTRKIPVVQVGSGFTMPPVDMDRVPPIRADRAPIMPESRVTSAMEKVVGDEAPRALIDLFRTQSRIVFGCPELDPYASFRRETLYLPPEPLPEFIEPPVEPRIFAYLGPEIPKIDQLLQTLTELNISIEFYLRGESAQLGRFLTLRGHRVHDTPPSLADVLPTVSHVVSAGGAFTCHAALAAGRPMLAIPLHGEAEMNISAMERLGVGHRFDRIDKSNVLRSAIIGFLRDHHLLTQARHWAKVLALRTQPDGLTATLGAIRQALAEAYRPDSAMPIDAAVRS
jgi:hypothetical protein